MATKDKKAVGKIVLLEQHTEKKLKSICTYSIK